MCCTPVSRISVQHDVLLYVGTPTVPGLRQGSKLHRILQQQGDLEQLPAWLQSSTPQDFADRFFGASPTLFNHQQQPGKAPADEVSRADAASDETVAELSLALAALQEAIQQAGVATDMVALHAAALDTESNSPRKRLKSDADVSKQASAEVP